METCKFLILGAGPSGLAFAHTLRDLGEESFLIVEKEDSSGGLCRSASVDGAPLDIGGGHFLDVRRREVLELLFRFMPESEWRSYDRLATIRISDLEIEHPLEANLWRMPIAAQVDYLGAIAESGAVRGDKRPTSFQDWVVWKMGRKIAEDYMLPYNRKIWSLDLNLLGTYWLHKLPDVSFREVLLSCLQRKANGSLPAHGRFLYPQQHGYGEVWRRMGDALGDKVRLGTEVTEIDLGDKTVNRSYRATVLVNTLPWNVWNRAACLPPPIAAAVHRLVHTSIDVDYHPESPGSKAHWIYEPNEAISYHRILCRGNFTANGRGFWTETNSVRSPLQKAWRHHNEYAYPVNTIDKPEAMRVIDKWARANAVLPLGRWGTWEHMNSDIAVSLAMVAAQRAVQDT